MEDAQMIKLNVEGMTCGHCVTNVTEAIRRIMPAAVVQVDLANNAVVIDSAEELAARFVAAIAEAGYRVTDTGETAAVKPRCRCCA
jgi:copper chaperone